MVNWLYLSANTNEYKRSAALMAPRLLTWLALLCFSETQVCSTYLSSFNINTKKPWEILVFQVFHRCGRKEGQIRFPEKRGFWGKISRLQQPRLSPSEGLDFFPFGFKLITFLSRLTRWKSGKEIRHQGVEPGKGQEWLKWVDLLSFRFSEKITANILMLPQHLCFSVLFNF